MPFFRFGAAIFTGTTLLVLLTGIIHFTQPLTLEDNPAADASDTQVNREPGSFNSSAHSPSETFSNSAGWCGSDLQACPK